MSVDKLVDSEQLDNDLTAVADAIRTKGGSSASLSFPNGFVNAISEIATGRKVGYANKWNLEPSEYLIFSFDFEPKAIIFQCPYNESVCDLYLRDYPVYSGYTTFNTLNKYVGYKVDYLGQKTLVTNENKEDLGIVYGQGSNNTVAYKGVNHLWMLYHIPGWFVEEGSLLISNAIIYTKNETLIPTLAINNAEVLFTVQYNQETGKYDVKLGKVGTQNETGFAGNDGPVAAGNPNGVLYQIFAIGGS